MKSKDSTRGNSQITVFTQTVAYDDATGIALDDNQSGLSIGSTVEPFVHHTILSYTDGKLEHEETIKHDGNSYGTNRNDCWSYFYYGSYPFPMSALKHDHTNEGIASIYPDPVEDKLSMDIMLNSSNKLKITIADLAGHTLYETDYNGESGTNKISIDLPSVAKGIYIVNVSNQEGRAWIRKFVKM